MFSNSEKAQEAARELAMREHVYGKKGHLTPLDKRRIAIMQSIAEDYRELAAKDNLL